MDNQVETPQGIAPPWMAVRMVALGLFSAALLMVELGLTRLFATRFYPPVVFVLLSCAILGLGLGAAVATWQPNWRQAQYLPHYIAGTSASTVIAVVAVSSTGNMALLLPLALLPFFFAGLLLATLFSLHPTTSPSLYFADLVGAGGGILLITPLAQWFGLLPSMAIALVLLTSAGLLFAVDPHAADYKRSSHKSKLLLPLIVLIFTAIVGLLGTHWWTPTAKQLFAEKPIAAKLTGDSRVVATRWDTFARTDLIDPGHNQPYELYLDGAAGSVMPPAAGHPALLRDIGFFPFATEQPEQVFVIGPGGGLDLWFGLQSGAQEIVAVEVNPASVALLTEYGPYNGHLATQPNVRLVAGEGRTVLTREGRHYDLIFLSQVVTLAAEQSGYALVENRVYTVEAFATYLAHLRPAGMVALKLYDEPTLMRALATMVQVLRTYGLSEQEALERVIILLDPRHEPAVPLLMARTAPFTREDVLSIGAVANTVGFHPFFLPGLWAEPPLDSVMAGEQPLSALLATAPLQLTPTTDDQPFFFSFTRGIPQQLQPLLWLLGVIVGGGLVLLWFTLNRRLDQRMGYAGYFAAIGVGFMLIEITVMQQTQRFLGHPTTALTVVLATLLLGAGWGSWLIGRWLSGRTPPGEESTRRTPQRAVPRWPFVGILLMWATWSLLWPTLNSHFLAFSLPWRIGTVVAYLLPLALFMGMPFALGLRAVARFGESQIALAWAINGIASVAGTLLALLAALLHGYQSVAFLGWLCYAGALLWGIVVANTNQGGRA